MRVWLVNAAEPVPADGPNVRLFRMGMLGRSLRAAGHDVVRIASSFDHGRKVQRGAGVSDDVVLLEAPSYRKHLSYARIRHNRALASRFRRWAARQPAPDLIVSSFPPIELADAAVAHGLRYGVPVVVDVRDMWPDVAWFITPRLLRPLARVATWPSERMSARALRRATGLSGITEQYLDWGLRRAGRSAVTFDRWFPFGYEHPSFDEERLRAAQAFWDERGITSEHTVVAYVGAISHQFDAEPILRAAALTADVPQIRFVLCGSGDRLDTLRARARGLGNVNLAGWVEMPEIVALEERAALALLSVSDRPDYRESIPNKVPEYLAVGLPVAVGLADGVVARLVTKDGCGFSYRSDGEVLAAEVRALHGDPGRRHAMSSRATALFESTFRADVVYSSFVEHLENVVARTQAGR